MFCPNCGTNLPDGAAFCAGCGSPMPKAPKQEAPVQEAPVYTPPVQEAPVSAPPVQVGPVYTPPVAPAPPVCGTPVKSKKTWLKTEASPKAKQMSTLSMIFTACCAVILVLAVFISVFGPFYKIPIFKLALGDDYSDQVESLKSDLSDVDDALDWYQDHYTGDLNEDEIEKVFDLTKKMVKNPSFSNYRALAKAMNKTDEVLLFDICIAVLCASFGFVILLAVLGGLFKKTGLVIAALIFAIPANLLYGGVVFALLSAAALVMLIVVLRQINQEYKAYKKNLASVPTCTT